MQYSKGIAVAMAAATDAEEVGKCQPSSRQQQDTPLEAVPKRSSRGKRRATAEGLDGMSFKTNGILPKRSFSADYLPFHQSDHVHLGSRDIHHHDNGDIRLGIAKNNKIGVKLQLQTDSERGDNANANATKTEGDNNNNISKGKKKKMTLDELLQSNHPGRRRRRQHFKARGPRGRWEMRKSLSYGQMQDLVGSFHSTDIEDLKRSLHGIQQQRRRNFAGSTASSRQSISSFEEDRLTGMPSTSADDDDNDDTEDAASRPSLSSSDLAQKLANMFEDALRRHTAGNKGGELQSQLSSSQPTTTTTNAAPSQHQTLIPQVRDLIMKLSVQDMIQVVSHLDQSQGSQSPVRWNFLQDIIDPEHEVDWDGKLFTALPKQRSFRGNHLEHLHQSAKSLRSLRSQRSSKSLMKLVNQPGGGSSALLGVSSSKFDSFYQQSWKSFRSNRSNNSKNQQALHQSFQSNDDVSYETWIEEEEESSGCSSSSSYLRSEDGCGDNPLDDDDDNASEMSGFSLEAFTEKCDSSITFMDFWNSYETLEVTEHSVELELEVASEFGEDDDIEYEEILEESFVMEEEVEESILEESALLEVVVDSEAEKEAILPPSPQKRALLDQLQDTESEEEEILPPKPTMTAIAQPRDSFKAAKDGDKDSAAAEEKSDKVVVATTALDVMASPDPAKNIASASKGAVATNSTGRGRQTATIFSDEAPKAFVSNGSSTMEQNDAGKQLKCAATRGLNGASESPPPVKKNVVSQRTGRMLVAATKQTTTLSSKGPYTNTKVNGSSLLAAKGSSHSKGTPKRAVSSPVAKNASSGVTRPRTRKVSSLIRIWESPGGNA